MGFYLAGKCRICGKILTGSNGILCKDCSHRIRNYKWLTHFLGIRLLGYPLDDVEDSPKPVWYLSGIPIRLGQGC